MSTKEQLHSLIDKLTDNEVTFFLEFLKRILGID